jgi:hypothetical protein
LQGFEPVALNNTQTRFGAGMAVLSDLDGDGFNEVAVGAPFREEGFDQCGSVFLFLSPGFTNGMGSLYSHWQKSEFSLYNYGSSIAQLADLDGDGISDFAVGAPDTFLSAGGGVIVYSGRTRRTLLEALGSEYSAP